MSLFKRYILPRIIQWIVVIFVGTTVVFLVPRLSPMDPVQTTLSSMSSLGMANPEAIRQMEEVLMDLYGLRGTLLQQYLRFWSYLLKGDLGPSLVMFPAPVISVIGTAMPWTIGLMLVSTILAWLLGIALGTLTGYFADKTWAKILDAVIMCIYPIPNYIMALMLLFLFAYTFPLFPFSGAAGIGIKPGFNRVFIGSVLKHGFLPALSMILITTGWRFISQRALVTNVIGSDHVQYAELAALPRRKIMLNYVFRDTLLPQTTDLALSLGSIFGGALITEFVFSYPGLGQILYTAILQGDFNVIVGVSIFSIVGIATAALLIDLLYPLLDPRVRYH
ncbi:MAG: ABC transporter permease [Firmicutes bacterium]|nr:ABC transporter permease [Bacillota bacterium]